MKGGVYAQVSGVRSLSVLTCGSNASETRLPSTMSTFWCTSGAGSATCKHTAQRPAKHAKVQLRARCAQEGVGSQVLCVGRVKMRGAL